MVFETLFSLFDDDASGEISLTELLEKSIELGCDPKKVSDIFSKFDTDGSGDIDLSEFEQAMNLNLKYHFSKIDADDSGTITPEELKSVIDAKIIDEFLGVADRDGDGEISIEEFIDAIVQHPEVGLKILFNLPPIE